MEPRGIVNPKLTEKQEAIYINNAFQAISQAQSDMFLPTVLFDREKATKSILKAKQELEKVVK